MHTIKSAPSTIKNMLPVLRSNSAIIVRTARIKNVIIQPLLSIIGFVNLAKKEKTEPKLDPFLLVLIYPN